MATTDLMRHDREARKAQYGLCDEVLLATDCFACEVMPTAQVPDGWFGTRRTVRIKNGTLVTVEAYDGDQCVVVSAGSDDRYRVYKRFLWYAEQGIQEAVA